MVRDMTDPAKCYPSLSKFGCYRSDGIGRTWETQKDYRERRRPPPRELWIPEPKQHARRAQTAIFTIISTQRQQNYCTDRRTEGRTDGRKYRINIAPSVYWRRDNKKKSTAYDTTFHVHSTVVPALTTQLAANETGRSSTADLRSRVSIRGRPRKFFVTSSLVSTQNLVPASHTVYAHVGGP